MKPSPNQQVKTQYQAKEKLVDQLAGILKRKEGESKDAFKKRLMAVSSSKLLRLQNRQADSKKTKK